MRKRLAYTLIELIMVMGTSALLMGGLASVLCITSQALAPDASASDEDNRSSLALGQVTSDLRLALRFTERTAQAVTFTVPDRNSDAQVETIRYSWTGVAGAPLLFQYNGNVAVSIADNVQQFNVSALVRTIPADPLPVIPASVKYETFAEAESAGNQLSLTIGAPAGVAAGNLLIAAVALDGAFGATLTAPAGWSLLNRVEFNSEIGLAVWWKVASSSEASNYAFSWTNSRRSYGWIMRYSGAEPTAPAFVANSGNSAAVECLPMISTVNNAMVLRIAAVDGNNLTGGPAYHSLRTLDDNNGAVEAAASDRLLPSAGTTGTAAFGCSGADDFATMTIVIIPDDGA